MAVTRFSLSETKGYLQVQNARARPGSKTSGSVTYMELPSDGSNPYVYTYKREDGKPQVNFTRAETVVDVHNMRGIEDQFTLEDKGLELHKLHVPGDINWEDKEDVRQSESFCKCHCQHDHPRHL